LPEFNFSGNQSDVIHETVLPSARISGRRVRHVDLLPGTPSIVRNAEMVARVGTREQVLAMWQPGDLPVALEANAAFRVPANASLVIRVHYRRHFGDPVADRSQVGIYFAARTAPAVQAIELAADSGGSYEHRIDKALRAVAIRPVSGPSGSWVRVIEITAGGDRRELARIEMQRDWQRRYVFATPVAIAAGNRIAISVTPSQAAQWTSLTSEPVDPESPAKVVIEFVN
jgi:hypothetical protein